MYSPLSVSKPPVPFILSSAPSAQIVLPLYLILHVYMCVTHVFMYCPCTRPLLDEEEDGPDDLFEEGALVMDIVEEEEEEEEEEERQADSEESDDY